MVTVTAVAVAEPNFTVAPATKFDPLTDTTVPPASGPEVGIR